MNFCNVTANYLHWVTDASNFNTTDLKIKIKEEFEKLNFIKFGLGILTSLFTNMYTAFLWGIIRYLSLVCLQSCRNLQYTSVVSKDMLVSVTTSLMIRWLPIKDETSEKILKNLYCLFPYFNDSMLTWLSFRLGIVKCKELQVVFTVSSFWVTLYVLVSLLLRMYSNINVFSNWCV